MTLNAIEASLDGANQFSPAKRIQSSEETQTHVSIFGTFTATVTVQIRRGSNAWRDIDDFTAPTEQIYDLVGPIQVRVGVKSGNYSSGTVNVEIA